MVPSLSAANEVVIERLTSPLAETIDRELVRAVVSRVPDIWETFGFECRLNPARAQLDLGVAVTRERRGRELSSRCARDPALGRGVATESAWRCLSKFADEWCSEGSEIGEWSPFIFLEYDAGPLTHNVPIPSVFVALDSPLSRSEFPHLNAAMRAASLLRGGSLASALEERLEECFESLPGSGRVLHLGVMLGRPDTGLRLSLQLSAEDVDGYLRRLGGEPVAAAARLVLDSYPQWMRSSQVDFDFDPALRPRIGFGIRPDEARGETWETLLSDLVAAGSCDPACALAVLAWPGSIRSDSGLGLRRMVSHVKVVAEDGRLEAKVYLGVSRVRVGA